MFTEDILEAIKSKSNKRKEIAEQYAIGCKLALENRLMNPDWKKINAAIIERWSVSGLIYIKERAWKIVEGKIVKS